MNQDGEEVHVTRDDPVLFDMDGVILEGRGTDPVVYATAGEQALAALDIDPAGDQRAVFRDFVGDESLAEACRDLGIDVEVFWSNKERLASQLSHERLKRGSRGIHDDTAVLKQLCNEYILGLVSNNRQETVEFVTRYFGFESVFSVVRGRDPTLAGFNQRKPEPDYLLQALESLNSESGIYVGDREKDSIAASRAGMLFVHLDRPVFETHDDPSEAVATISSLAELPTVLSDLRSV